MLQLLYSHSPGALPCDRDCVFLLLLWLQRTSVGFWVIGGLLTLIYAAAAGLLACLLTEKDLVWGWVTFGIVFLVIGGLHLHARDN